MGCISSREKYKKLKKSSNESNKQLLKKSSICNLYSERRNNVITLTGISEWVKRNNGIKNTVDRSDIVVLPIQQKEDVKRMLEKSFIRHKALDEIDYKREN